KAFSPGVKEVGVDPQLRADLFGRLAAGEPVLNRFTLERIIEFATDFCCCLFHGLCLWFIRPILCPSIRSKPIASYSYEALRMMLWPIPPNPLAFSIFVFTLLTVFVSHWLIRPVTGKLFAERPDYWTQRMPTGEKRVTIIHAEKEPLL